MGAVPSVLFFSMKIETRCSVLCGSHRSTCHANVLSIRCARNLLESFATFSNPFAGTGSFAGLLGVVAMIRRRNGSVQGDSQTS